MSGQQTRDYIVRGADGSVKIVHQERVNHRNTANNLTAYAGRRKIQNNLKKQPFPFGLLYSTKEQKYVLFQL